MTLTKSLGQFVADLSPNRLPEEAARIARMGFIDCIGTMIAGRKEDCVRIITDTLAPGDGRATLTFGARKSPAPEAAWINGTAAHALDYDDVGLRGHPSTVLVPAILAEAENLGSSGADMITAYVAGYETWAELFRRDSGLLHQKGWHPTGLYGAVGAAAACAKLRKLDAEKSAIAIALGASQSAGLMSNFGTMTKPFHAGKAAHAGIMAARLAEAGFTANTDALEHPQGFLHAISPTGTEDRTSESRAGQEWAILTQGLGIKKYPTCYCTHRAIDCMLDLVNQTPVNPADVKKITVNISDYFSTVLRNHQPDTGLAAKFSIEFAMASGIIAKRVGLRELTDDFVQRPDIQALMRKVEVVKTTEYDPDMPGAAPHDSVVVELADGKTIAGEPVARATGHASRPLTDAQLYEKFVDCLDAGGTDIPADVLFKRLSAIQSTSARALTALH
ncbi:MAG TPA: MmgE/PrpD family protein [Acetobacteraceae bacterium]|nr:MmgE/PrpD family protein [Acetobacteraceae bacterium]